MNRIRRLSEEVLEGHRSEFGADFAANKAALQKVSVIRSKKLRNCMAGLITRMISREMRRQKETEEQERSQAARAKSAANETLVIFDADALHGPILDHVSGRPVAVAEAAGTGRRLTIPDTVCEELEVWMAAHSDLRDRVPPSELRSILSAMFGGRKGLFTRPHPGAAHLKKAEDMHKSALDDAESEQAGRWLELKSVSGQDKAQDLERLYSKAAADRALLAAAMKQSESSRVMLVSGDGNLLAFAARASAETDGMLSVVDAEAFCSAPREAPAQDAPAQDGDEP